MRAIYPGSFYPFHFGHLDIACRAAKIFDEVSILLAHNSSKPSNTTILDLRKEAEVIKDALYACSAPENIDVNICITPVATYGYVNKYDFMIRGIRNGYDLEYETQVLTGNRILNPSLDTLFLPTKPEYEHLSSSLVREMMQCDLPEEELLKMVPLPVYKWMMTRKMENRL